MPRPRLQIVIVLLLSLTAGAPSLAAGEADADSNSSAASTEKVLVLVGDESITDGDLQFMMLSRGIASDAGVATRRRLVEQLIDRRLVGGYLKDRKAEPDPLRVDAQVERVKRLIRGRDQDPDDVLARFGFTEQRLREEIALPLAWKKHFNRVVADEEFQDYFRRHREELDGTEVRASHILLKAADQAEQQRAESELLAIREKILSGERSFSEAARAHSQAPSAEDGGDVGFFPYEGRMPVSFSAAAFPLKIGDVSRPFATPFGMHICTVTARKPGQFSLEDVRSQVFRRMSEQKWDELSAELRRSVRIEWQAELE